MSFLSIRFGQKAGPVISCLHSLQKITPAGDCLWRKACATSTWPLNRTPPIYFWLVKWRWSLARTNSQLTDGDRITSKQRNNREEASVTLGDLNVHSDAGGLAGLIKKKEGNLLASGQISMCAIPNERENIRRHARLQSARLQLPMSLRGEIAALWVLLKAYSRVIFCCNSKCLPLVSFCL